MTTDLIIAANRLAETLARENTALATLDLATAAAMLGPKQSATASFLAARQAPGGPVPGVELERSMEHLQLLCDENRALLKRAIIVQQRVIEVVARAIPRQPAGPRYGARGSSAETGRSIPVALSTRA